jgi:hypothetical protein
MDKAASTISASQDSGMMLLSLEQVVDSLGVSQTGALSDH